MKIDLIPDANEWIGKLDDIFGNLVIVFGFIGAFFLLTDGIVAGSYAVLSGIYLVFILLPKLTKGVFRFSRMQSVSKISLLIYFGIFVCLLSVVLSAFGIILFDGITAYTALGRLILPIFLFSIIWADIWPDQFSNM